MLFLQQIRIIIYSHSCHDYSIIVYSVLSDILHHIPLYINATVHQKEHTYVNSIPYSVSMPMSSMNFVNSLFRSEISPASHTVPKPIYTSNGKSDFLSAGKASPAGTSIS
jgi:hypothetical protein